MNSPNRRQTRPVNYHAGLNRHLAAAAPAEALRALEVGCGTGRLGAALKAQAPGRVVFGAERNRDAAALAAHQPDRVFTLHVEREDVPLPAGSLDALRYGDVLEHFADPLGVRLQHRRLLHLAGVVLDRVSNVQHPTALTARLKGDWPSNSHGVRLPPSFVASARTLARTWPADPPVATSCALIGADGFRPLGLPDPE